MTLAKEELNQSVLNLSWQRDVEGIAHYLNDGADVDARDERDGRTGLMKAADRGSDELVKLFLDRGAGVNLASYSERSVLMSACSACTAGTVELILDMGANIAARCEEHTTALMRAATSKNSGVVSLLLERGADVNTQDRIGSSALIWFSRTGNTDGVRLLLQSPDFRFGCSTVSLEPVAAP